MKFRFVDKFSVSSMINRIAAEPKDYDIHERNRERAVGEQLVTFLRTNVGSYAVKYNGYSQKVPNMFEWLNCVTEVKVYEILEDITDDRETMGD